MEPALAIHEFLEYLVSGLVEHAGDVTVERERRGDTHLFRITVHPLDHARLVGRGGRTIEAIQSLVNASAEKHGLHAEVEMARDTSSRDPR